MNEKLKLEDLINKLIKIKTNEEIVGKAAEEGAELTEVLIKYITKAEADKPTLEKIAEEASHVLLRTTILIKKLNIEELVNSELEKKVEQLTIYYNKQINTNVDQFI